jgi:(2Fe-2S) ferredoxin
MAERRDAWKSAQVLLHGGDWYEGVKPEDVLELAQWLHNTD